MDVKTAFSDPALEKDGVWIDYREGSRIKIARMGNPRFQRTWAAAMKPYRRLERENKIPPETQTEVLCQVYAESLLLDWEGFTSDGEPLPYTKETAKRLLMAHMDFRDDVTMHAGNEEQFKQAHDEDSEKNSPSAFDGT